MDYHIYTSSAAKTTDTDRTRLSSIGRERLSQLARQTKFQQRDRGKITPEVFVHTLREAAFKQASSFRQLAVLSGCHAEDTVAKQSVWERVNARAAKFLGAVLCEAMGEQCAIPKKFQGTINRVLVADSTIQKLHPSVHKAFPGARNQSDAIQACARIQVVADLLAGQFVQFGLSGFTRNDQAASHDLLSIVTAGDLVLRDLGYFTLDSQEAIDQRDAFFLSRLRYKTTLLDEDGVKIELLPVLRRAANKPGQSVVIEALLGARKKLPVRVVAVRLPSKVAEERRRKARADRDLRLSHKDEYYELLNWTILVTNLPSEVVSDWDLVELYGLRWRIENIFKAWKSGLRLSYLSAHRSNPWHLHCLLLGQMLALADLSRVGLFAMTAEKDDDIRPAPWGQPTISLFKALDILLLCGQIHSPCHRSEELCRQIGYHGRYEKRKRTPLPCSEALR